MQSPRRVMFYNWRALASTFRRYLLTMPPRDRPPTNDATEIDASSPFSATILVASMGAEGLPLANFRMRFPTTIGDL